MPGRLGRAAGAAGAAPAPPGARFRTGTQRQAVGEGSSWGAGLALPSHTELPALARPRARPWDRPGTARVVLGWSRPGAARPYRRALRCAGGLAIKYTRAGRRWLKQSFCVVAN